MSVLARWCFRHRFVVVGAWLFVLALLGVTNSALGSRFSDTFTLPGTDSTKAHDLLSSQFKGGSGDSDTIVLHVKSGTVNDPDVRADVTAMLAQVAKVPE